MLIMAASDTGGESYYGEQGLHFVDIRGDSCLVARGTKSRLHLTDGALNCVCC